MLSMKYLVFVVLVVSFAASSQSAVICYYGSWATYRPGNGQYNVDHIDPFLCTHLVYTFAGIDNWGNIISLDPSLDLSDNWGRDNFRRFNALKQRNPNLRTLLAVGGYGEGSAKYSIMAANQGYRNNFVNSAIRYLQEFGFDGLDLDWEYPNQRDTVHGHADINNFTTLLRELREAFNRYGFLLTAAVAATRPSALQSYDIPAISQSLDIVNIMTYDMAGSWDPATGHNAPLHRGEGNANEEFTVEQSLRFWISAGCPVHKIAVGVPFYARSFTLAYAGNNGVGAPAVGPGSAGPYTRENGFMGFNEICHLTRVEPWYTRYDNSARVPYTVRDNNWVTFDDADSLAVKVRFARSLGITSVMVWTIETDDFHGICGGGVNPLLRSINAALYN